MLRTSFPKATAAAAAAVVVVSSSRPSPPKTSDGAAAARCCYRRSDSDVGAGTTPPPDEELRRRRRRRMNFAGRGRRTTREGEEEDEEDDEEEDDEEPEQQRQQSSSLSPMQYSSSSSSYSKTAAAIPQREGAATPPRQALAVPREVRIVVCRRSRRRVVALSDDDDRVFGGDDDDVSAITLGAVLCDFGKDGGDDEENTSRRRQQRPQRSAAADLTPNTKLRLGRSKRVGEGGGFEGDRGDEDDDIRPTLPVRRNLQPRVIQSQKPRQQTASPPRQSSDVQQKLDETSTTAEEEIDSVVVLCPALRQQKKTDPDGASATALEILRQRRMDSPDAVLETCRFLTDIFVAAAAEDDDDGPLDDAAAVEAIEIVLQAAAAGCCSTGKVGGSSAAEAAAEEALRTVVAIASRSDAAALSLLESPLHRLKVRMLCTYFRNSMLVQTAYCHVLAAIFHFEQILCHVDVVSELLESLLGAMSANPYSELLQQAACNALRILAPCREDCGGTRFPISQLVEAVFIAMEFHKSSKPIQLCCCSFLRNVAVSRRRDRKRGLLDDPRCVAALMEALRSHLDDASVVEMACTALSNLMYSSEGTKRRVAELEGAVDTVMCVLMMYRDDPSSAIESAVRVLASMASSRDVAFAVVSDQMIECVCDVLQNNVSSREILVPSMRILRNAVTVAPEMADNCSEAVSVVVGAVTDNARNADLQEEACNLLWIMAAKSEECRSKILAFDGVSILMEALEGADSKSVQDAAFGAFNALALSPPATT